MNRCLPLPIARYFALFVLALFWTSVYGPNTAQAQNTRQFPLAAKRGMLVVTAPPVIQINGANERLSPGARIKGPNNLLVMSASLVGTSVLVNYVRDGQGMIHEVWILSAEEAQEKRSGMEPVTNYTSGFDADKPKTDDGKTPFNQLPKYPKQ